MIPILLALLLSQAKVDLSTQTKNANFGAFAHTTPQGVVSSLPGTCSTGETVFLSTATPGQNLFLCSGTNTWSQLIATGGGATSLSQMTDFQMSVSGAVLTISAGSYRINTQVVPVNASTATVTGGAGVLYVYGDLGGVKVASSGLSVTCSGCNFLTGAVIPAGSVPIGTASSTFGTSWDTNGVTDLRGWLYQKAITTGLGFIQTELPGSTQFSIDQGSIQWMVAVPTTATDTCVAGSVAISTTFRYECVATDTWRRVAIATW